MEQIVFQKQTCGDKGARQAVVRRNNTGREREVREERALQSDFNSALDWAGGHAGTACQKPFAPQRMLDHGVGVRSRGVGATEMFF